MGAEDEGEAGEAGVEGAFGPPPAGSVESVRLVVQTHSGFVQGALGPRGGSRHWLGVPYASAPGRWQLPEEHSPWTGTKDTTAYGPSCAQMKGDDKGSYPAGQMEDCLRLNIYAPVATSVLFPTAVFLHGGAFTSGSGDYRLAKMTGPVYDGTDLVETGAVCVVTLNYRLGPFGWFAHKALGTVTNFGFADQQFALKWVRNNGAAFGCDPDAVTLFGESAGAMSVFNHLMAPTSKGLFQRAVMESGTFIINQLPPLADVQAQGAKLAEAVGCANATDADEELACLRSRPMGDMHALGQKVGLLFGEGALWLPVLDGEDGFFPDDPGAMLEESVEAESKFAPNVNNLIMGVNRNEGSEFVVAALGLFSKIGTAEYDQLVNSTLGPFFTQADVQRIISFYPPDAYGGAKQALIAALGDGIFVCPARKTARLLARLGATTRLYSFEHELAAIKPLPYINDLGVFHSSELPFVFHTPSPLYPLIFARAEQTLADIIQSLWLSFFAHGEPSQDSGVPWSVFGDATKGQQEDVLHIDEHPYLADGFKVMACDLLWDSVKVRLDGVEMRRRAAKNTHS